MKEFFGYDISLSEDMNKKRTQDYVSRELNDELKTDLDNITRNIENFQKQNQSTLLQAKFTFVLMGVLLLSSFFVTMIKEGAQSAFETTWVFLASGILFIGVAVFLYIKSIRRRKDLEKSDVVKKINDSLEAFIDKRNNYFEIPSEYYDVDVLASRFQTKKTIENGNEVNRIIYKNIFGAYTNVSIACYVKNECLCFCDNEEEFQIPFKDIASCELVDEKAKLINWNKEEPFNSPKYSEFLITAKSGYLSIPKYGKIIIKKDDEEYIIRIASYDFDNIRKMITL